MISGTLRLLGRSHRMQRRTPRTKAGFVWQKLANALALLATAMLIAHGAAAGSLVPHSHAHISVHAESSPTATNVADPVPHHAPSMAVGEEPSDDNHDTLACCGDACLAALIPGRTADLKEPRRSDQKFVMPVSLLSKRCSDHTLAA